MTLRPRRRRTAKPVSVAPESNGEGKGNGEAVDGQTAFLDAMNRAEDVDFDFILEIVLREWQGRFSYQINVGAVYVLPSE